MTIHSQVTQYLNRYVQNESREAARFALEHCATVYKRAVCVPVYDESIAFLKTLARHPHSLGTLLILVVNAPDNAECEAHQRTLGLLKSLRKMATATCDSDQTFLATLGVDDLRLDLLVMDCCTAGRALPAKEGVGLARKLGNDVALELWHEERVASPWLFQTDGDASLPYNWFDVPREAQQAVAHHLDFRHVNAAGVSPAQDLYDLKLDYYVAGLAFAGSPFSHYSLGSAIVIHAKAYAVVRGYPKRSAGEDFYILDKLAKYGVVYFDRSRTIELQERQSDRVPFGTGQAVARLSALHNASDAAEFYAPDCFEALKTWLRFLEDCAEQQAGKTAFSAEDYFNKNVTQTPVTRTLVAALEQLDLFAWCNKTIQKNARTSQAKHQIKLGMDALKTLQLVHAMRDQGLHNVRAVEAKRWLADLPEKLLNAHTRLGSDSDRHVVLRTP